MNGAHLNTALTSTFNWGSKILTDEAQLVTTHELGHNWGAFHDDNVQSLSISTKEDGKYRFLRIRSISSMFSIT